MFCAHCGNSLGDAAKFCSKCGAEVTQSVEGLDQTPTEAPKKKKFSAKKLTVGIAIVVAVLVLLGTAAFSLYGTSIRDAFYGTKNYYLILEKSNLGKTFKNLSNEYKAFFPSQYSYEGSFSGKLSGDLVDASGLNEQTNGLLSKIKMKIRMDGNNENLDRVYSSSSFSLELDNKELATVNMENADNKTLFSFPGLTDKTLGTKTPDQIVLLEKAFRGDEAAFRKVFGMDRAGFNKLLKKYLEEVIFDCIPDDNVKFDRSAELNGISCNSIEFTLNERILSQMMKSISAQMQNDAEFKTVYTSFLKYYFDMIKQNSEIAAPSTSEMLDSLKDFCDKLGNEAKDVEPFTLSYAIYFDNDGTILSRTLTDAASKTQFKLSSYKDSNDKDISELYLTSDGNSVLQFRNESQLKGKIRAGAANLNVQGQQLLQAKYQVEEDAMVGNMRAFVGKVEGKLFLNNVPEPSSIQANSLDFSLESKRNGEDKLSGNLSITTQVNGQSLTISLLSEMSQKNQCTKEKPNISLDNTLDVSDPYALEEFGREIGQNIIMRLQELFSGSMMQGQ